MTPTALAPAATLTSESATVAIPKDGQITFGRGTHADVRIGDAPVYDDIVPRCAGRVFAIGDRVIVENLDDTLAFDLRVEGRPLISVAPGDLHSPRDAAFEIVVAGGVRSYALEISIDGGGGDCERETSHPHNHLDSATGAVPTLTARQRAILDAYVRPLRHGGPVASHQQVADELRISRSLVRVECERIWNEMFQAAVPMRSLGAARDEIADAWSRHRI